MGGELGGVDLMASFLSSRLAAPFFLRLRMTYKALTYHFRFPSGNWVTGLFFCPKLPLLASETPQDPTRA